MKEIDITSFLYTLYDIGVTGIKVYYEGAGDSGAIEDILVTTDKEYSLDDPDSYFDGQTKLSEVYSGSIADFENFLHGKLLDNIEDWWNDEGGYGYVFIEIPSGKYKIENNIRFVDYEFYEHQDSLLNKTNE